MCRSDIELVLLAKNGDSEATTELFKRYTPLIQKASRQSHLAVIAEDALSEAQIAFIEAVYSFDETRGTPFAGYVREMIYGKLRTFFKHERRLWQREVYPATSCDDEGNETDFWESIADEHDDIAAFIDHEDLQSALNSLTSKQREVIFLLYFKGFSQHEVAERLNISQQAVAKCKKGAIKALSVIHR